jgi:saccharopine dehydrogenase (NAD+, L-lysine forming)
MIGIRREDKSRWEARVPLTPADVRELSGQGVRFQVQTSPIRTFTDATYRDAGVEVVEELNACQVIIGVKEIPVRWLAPDKAYMFFSHTIKGQPANMPMLRRILDLGCTLIDYERIVDDRGRRLVFFGRYAGLAGMIDTLWALGRRLQHEGCDNPFTAVRRAFEYEDLAHAKREIAALGARIRQHGLPPTLHPLVCGFAGYGNVAQGAQEIYDLLPIETITPQDLPHVKPAANVCYKVVFREEHLVTPAAPGAAFELQDYYQHPERYRAAFAPHVPHLTLLVNCIYWEPKYPRLVTNAQLRELFGDARPPRLRVIGDITCDIDGSIECTVKATEPGDPVFVYEPRNGHIRDGILGDGPVILAVDILPCELPVDASTHFGQALRPFIPALAKADFTKPLAACGLPPELARATIAYRGELTEPYRYLKEKV